MARPGKGGQQIRQCGQHAECGNAHVRVAVERAPALSTEREAHLFAFRAKEFLTGLIDEPRDD